jgi:hypothetical protein
MTVHINGISEVDLLTAALVGMEIKRQEIITRMQLIRTSIGVKVPQKARPSHRPLMSAKARRAISVAQKKRWAAFRKAKG